MNSLVVDEVGVAEEVRLALDDLVELGGAEGEDGVVLGHAARAEPAKVPPEVEVGGGGRRRQEHEHVHPHS